MADRRMFAKTIIDSDAFLEMPTSCQMLYFHLAMRADDDGFINNPKKIQKMVNCSDDDLRILIMKNFVIPFDSGVVVIKHWKIHNYIRKDRYKETAYQDEKNLLFQKDNGAYTLAATSGLPMVDQRSTQVRLGKDSIGKDSIDIYMHDAESSATVPEDDTAYIFLPLNDKSLYPIHQYQINEWHELYPCVDIEQELKKMKGWLDSNPTRRKTARGIKAFITNWLSRQQDKGPPQNRTSAVSSGNPFKDRLQKELNNARQTDDQGRKGNDLDNGDDPHCIPGLLPEPDGPEY